MAGAPARPQQQGMTGAGALGGQPSLFDGGYGGGNRPGMFGPFNPPPMPAMPPPPSATPPPGPPAAIHPLMQALQDQGFRPNLFPLRRRSGRDGRSGSTAGGGLY